MDVEFKIKNDMESLGCQSKRKVALAYHLYLYLIDVKLMYDVEYCYNKDVDTLYVVARPNKNEKLNIYIPFPTSDDVTMELIETLQENLCTVETGPSINLAFIEGDFSTVIYNFTRGLIDLKSSEGLTHRRNREERRSFIDKELKMKKEQILKDALDGGVVDDDDDQIIE